MRHLAVAVAAVWIAGNREIAALGGGQHTRFSISASREPGARGVLVGLGWTGNWDAQISRRGTRLSARAGLPKTRFYLRPDRGVYLGT